MTPISFTREKTLAVQVVRISLAVSTSLILLLATSLYVNSTVAAKSLVAPLGPLDLPPFAPTLDLLPTTPIQKIDISDNSWNPSSPDPAGIAYWPSRGTLLVTDSEVDEMPGTFTGDNVFESSLTGTLLGSCSTTTIHRGGWSKEPTGVAINPNNNHIYFSDDTAPGSIHEVDLGPDEIYCTVDDTVNTVPAPGSGDAEGIAYGENKLFIAGGIDEEVYILDLGPDGLLRGGVDSPVTSFDTDVLGFHDVEGIEYNADAGTLFLVSTAKDDPYIGEVSLAGELINVYNLNYLGRIPRSGLAYGPSSWNPDVKSIYLVSSGIDNDTDPDENDGVVWEIHLGFLPIDPEPPSVNAIARANPDPTSASSVQFTVTFSEAVSGVSEADFILSTTDGITGASVTEVSGSGSMYTVTVNTGRGNGTIRLDLVDTDSIISSDTGLLGGPGAGSGSYTSGESYTVHKGSIRVEPASLDFEENIFLSSPNTKTVTVHNDGEGPVQLGKLLINDSQLAGQTMFLVDNRCDNVLLEAGSSCTVDVAFRPVGWGAVSGQITIPSDVLGNQYSVDLSGSGIGWIRTLFNFAYEIGADVKQLFTE